MAKNRRKPGLALRPSSMDRAFACPGSHYPEEGEVLVRIKGAGGGPAAIGKAAHEVYRAEATGEPYDLAEICGRLGVQVRDVQYLRWAAARFVELIQREFEVASWAAEEELVHGGHVEHLELKGTPDLWGVLVDDSTAILTDLKTGYAGGHYEHQMRAYADLIFGNRPDVEKVVVLICWARDMEVQKWEWTRQEIEAWVLEVEERVFGWDGTSYTVGLHCGFCPRQTACEARSREFRAAHEIMLADTSIGALTPEGFAKMWEASILIPRAVERWRERVRERIMATGPIPLGDGFELALVERNGKPEIDTALAAEVLKGEFELSDEELMVCFDLRKKDVEDLVASKVSRGQKGARRKELTERLVEAGALVPRQSMVFKVIEGGK